MICNDIETIEISIEGLPFFNNSMPHDDTVCDNNFRVNRTMKSKRRQRKRCFLR